MLIGRHHRSIFSNWKAVYPHCLRKAYETVLHSQPIDGGNLSVKVQEFFMGHVLPGSQDPYFDRSKIEHMRNQYSRLEFGRSAVENKFKVLKAAVSRVFEDTSIDPEKVIEDYVKLKLAGECTRQFQLAQIKEETELEVRIPVGAPLSVKIIFSACNYNVDWYGKQKGARHIAPYLCQRILATKLVSIAT